MIRTQIYLTPKQHRLLKIKAETQDSTLSKEIREFIEKGLQKEEKPKQKQNTGKWLLSMAQEAEELGLYGPTDLASNVDRYLYGKGQ